MTEIEKIVTDYLEDYSLEELLDEFNIDPAEAFSVLLDADYISKDEFYNWLSEDLMEEEETE